MSLRKNCATTRRAVIAGMDAMTVNASGAGAYVAAPTSPFDAEPLSLRRPFALTAWRELFHQAGIGNFHVTPLLPLRMSAWIEIAA
jgi:hypothetical protein